MKIFNFRNTAKLFGYYWLFVLALYIVQILLTIFIPQYAGLFYTLSLGFAVCGALKLTEEVLFADIDTSNLLSKNPIAYAIYIFAFAYIFSIAML